MRETLIRPIGLITQPNEQGQYPPGAMSRAFNVVIRDPGVLTALPDTTAFSTGAFVNGYTARRMFDMEAVDSSGDASLLAVAETTGPVWQVARISDANEQAISFPELTYTAAVGKIQMAKYQGRYYLTSEQGVLHIADVDTNNAYLAGWPPPRMLYIDTVETTGAQSIPTGKNCAYRVVFVRRDSDGVISKISPPSFALLFDSPSGSTVDVQVDVSWPDQTTVAAGDIVEVYRTRVQDSGVDPGSTYYLDTSFELTSSEVSAQAVSILCTAPDSGLGSELYTNESFGGEAKSKDPPGLASDVAIFNDYAFYIVEEEASVLEFRVPGTWGTLSSAADRTHGIGSRATTANYSSGSPNLTSIADTTGLVVGMLLTGSDWPAGTTITAVDTGAGTATASQNSTGAGTGAAVTFSDRMEINGDLVTVAQVLGANGGLNDLPSDNPVHIRSSQTLDAGFNTTVAGLALQFWIPHRHHGDVTLRVTNGDNYDPPLPELSESVETGSADPRTNRLRVAEKGQPWAVAPDDDSEIIVGYGDAHRVVATSDALYVFCSDGLYRITGPDWIVDQLDPTLTLSRRNAVGVLGNIVWAHTSRGLVRIIGTTVQDISEGLIGDSETLPGQAYADGWDLVLACDEAEREVHLLDASASEAWMFNTSTQSFSVTDYDRGSDTIDTIAYIKSLRKLMWLQVPSGAARPIRYFLDDLESEDAVTAGAEVIFQPITGDGESFTMKEWIDCVYDMKVLSGSGGNLELYPEFTEVDQSAYPVEFPATAVGKRTKKASGISREVSVAPTIAPGFTALHSSASVAFSRWKLYGLSLRWMPAAEETGVR